ncbi:hypothetical protein HK097_000627, partial [Rhizophlyctis rosea]
MKGQEILFNMRRQQALVAVLWVGSLFSLRLVDGALLHRKAVRIDDGSPGPFALESGNLFSYTVPKPYRNLTDMRGTSVDGTVGLPPWMWFNNLTGVFAGKHAFLTVAREDHALTGKTGSPYTNLPIPHTSVRIFFTGINATSSNTLVTLPFTVLLDGNHPPLPQSPTIPQTRASGITYQQLTNNIIPTAYVNITYKFVFPRGLIIDEDGDPLAYRAEALHQENATERVWLRFDNSSLEFSGTPLSIAPLDIVVIATDPAGAAARVTFHIDVQNSTQTTTSADPSFTPPADIAADQYAINIIKIVVPIVIVVASVAACIVWACARRTNPRFSKYSDVESVRSARAARWSYGSNGMNRKDSARSMVTEEIPPVPVRRVLTVRNEPAVAPAAEASTAATAMEQVEESHDDTPLAELQPKKRPASLVTSASNPDTVRDLYALYLDRIGKRGSGEVRSHPLLRVPSRTLRNQTGHRRTASEELRCVGERLGAVEEEYDEIGGVGGAGRSEGLEDDQRTLTPGNGGRSGGSSQRRKGRSVSVGVGVEGMRKVSGNSGRRRTGSGCESVESIDPIIITPPPELASLGRRDPIADGVDLSSLSALNLPSSTNNTDTTANEHIDSTPYDEEIHLK